MHAEELADGATCYWHMPADFDADPGDVLLVRERALRHCSGDAVRTTTRSPSCAATCSLTTTTPLPRTGSVGAVMAYGSCKSRSAWTTMVASRSDQGGPGHEKGTAVGAGA
jgi:hypothetical protein